MNLTKIISKAKKHCKEKTIRKRDIIYAFQLQQGGNLDFESNFCGYNLTQCYNPPKPCSGCQNQAGGAKQKFIQQMKKKCRGYKITSHAMNLLFNVVLANKL